MPNIAHVQKKRNLFFIYENFQMGLSKMMDELYVVNPKNYRCLEIDVIEFFTYHFCFPRDKNDSDFK